MSGIRRTSIRTAILDRRTDPYVELVSRRSDCEETNLSITALLGAGSSCGGFVGRGRRCDRRSECDRWSSGGRANGGNGSRIYKEGKGGRERKQHDSFLELGPLS